MNDADFERWIRMLASPSDGGPLPDAALIWAKASARKRLEASERAIRPIRLAETIIAVVCVFGAVVLFPVNMFETLNPIVLRLSGLALAGVATVSVLLLRLLFAAE
jgi:hypothetical protein